MTMFKYLASFDKINFTASLDMVTEACMVHKMVPKVTAYLKARDNMYT